MADLPGWEHTAGAAPEDGAVMVHATARLGFAHAYFVRGLRHAEGWIGYGTHIDSARCGRLAWIAPRSHQKRVIYLTLDHSNLSERLMGGPSSGFGRARLWAAFALG